MFNRSELADVLITIGSTSIPAHRFVLCLQSSYFYKALEGGFEESSTKRLHCEPGKEQAYVRVLQWLYSGDYEDDPSDLISEEGMAVLNRLTLLLK